MHVHVLFFFKYVLASALFEKPIFTVINVYLFNPSRVQLILWLYHKFIVWFFHRDHPFGTQGLF